MNRIALAMLFGRPGRYAAMVCGLSFAVLLMTQQTAIFLGVLIKSTGPLQYVGNVDIWVSTQHTKYINMARSIRNQDLYRVESLPGVAWAEPFCSAKSMAELPDGKFHAVQLVGIDRSTLVGQPPMMVRGKLSNLRGPDTVLLDASQRGCFPGIDVGDELRLNGQRARVVGICRAKTDILSRPLVFTTHKNAVRFAPTGKHAMNWMLVKLKPGENVLRVCQDIQEQLHLAAFPADKLRWITMKYIISETAIGLNFLMTILLGLLVGLVISAATFNQFTTDNLPHFAVLKAIGTRSSTLVRMVLLQGVTTGLISYGIGVGLAALVSLPGRAPDAELTSHFPWQLMLGALAPVVICVVISSLVSIWRVVRLDPVVVFQ